MKYTDLQGYSPGTELYWNAAYLWQNGDGRDRTIMRPERLLRDGGRVLVNVIKNVWNNGTYTPTIVNEWVTLAGIRGPLAPCQSRIAEQREWQRKARATKAARDEHKYKVREELSVRFKALGLSPHAAYNDVYGGLLVFSEADLQQILNAFAVQTAWLES